MYRRQITFLSDSAAIGRFFKQLAANNDELVPLTDGDRFGHSYQRLNRMVDNGSLKVYVLYGTRYAKRSTLENLEAPKRGRPKGSNHLRKKALTPEQTGHVI